MTNADARRVAAYHTSNPTCAVYDTSTAAAWTPETWQAHFERDLRNVKLGQRLHGTKPERDAETARIIALMTQG